MSKRTSLSFTSDIIHHAEICLDGTNYNLRASTTIVFLKGLKLLCHVSGDLHKPEQFFVETSNEYSEHLEDWESTHFKILSWFINTSTLSHSSLLQRF